MLSRPSIHSVGIADRPLRGNVLRCRTSCPSCQCPRSFHGPQARGPASCIYAWLGLDACLRLCPIEAMSMSLTPTIASLLGPISIGIILSSMYVIIMLNEPECVPIDSDPVQCIWNQPPANVLVLHQVLQWRHDRSQSLCADPIAHLSGCCLRIDAHADC